MVRTQSRGAEGDEGKMHALTVMLAYGHMRAPSAARGTLLYKPQAQFKCIGDSHILNRGSSDNQTDCLEEERSSIQVLHLHKMQWWRRKRTGAGAFCVNCTALNKTTAKQKFPMPCINKLFGRWRGSAVYL